MAGKGAMAGTFELTPELRGSLGLRDREYVVKDPVEIVVETKGGSLLKPPQEIRERIVRCRDCVHFRPPSKTDRARCDGVFAFVEPNQDGFCAWGKRRGES